MLETMYADPPPHLNRLYDLCWLAQSLRARDNDIRALRVDQEIRRTCDNLTRELNKTPCLQIAHEPIGGSPRVLLDPPLILHLQHAYRLAISNLYLSDTEYELVRLAGDSLRHMVKKQETATRSRVMRLSRAFKIDTEETEPLLTYVAGASRGPVVGDRHVDITPELRKLLLDHAERPCYELRRLLAQKKGGCLRIQRFARSLGIPDESINPYICPEEPAQASPAGTVERLCESSASSSSSSSSPCSPSPARSTSQITSGTTSQAPAQDHGRPQAARPLPDGA